MNDTFPSNGFVQSVDPGEEATVETVKADLNFLHGKFDSAAGHSHNGEPGQGPPIFAANYDSGWVTVNANTTVYVTHNFNLVDVTKFLAQIYVYTPGYEAYISDGHLGSDCVSWYYPQTNTIGLSSNNYTKVVRLRLWKLEI